MFGKVRLGDLIGAQQGLSKGERQRALNRITSKHLDFVLCRASDMHVVCAVELDDKTHQQTDRKARDAFLDRALKAAGVPLLRFPVRRSYDVLDLREVLGTLGLSQEEQRAVSTRARAVRFTARSG